MSEKYNGWNNYATWLVNLHFTNNEGDYERLRELTEESRVEFDDAYPDYVPGQTSDDEYIKENKQDTISDLADKLKAMVESDIDDLLENTHLYGGFVSDALNSVVSDIDWHEWAENLLEF